MPPKPHRGSYMTGQRQEISRHDPSDVELEGIGKEKVNSIQESVVFTRLLLFGLGLCFYTWALGNKDEDWCGSLLPSLSWAINGGGLSVCRPETDIDIGRSKRRSMSVFLVALSQVGSGPFFNYSKGRCGGGEPGH